MAQKVSPKRAKGSHDERLKRRKFNNKLKKKGTKFANFFACKVCWRRTREYVEFELNGAIVQRWANNNLYLECPNCLTKMPHFETVYDAKLGRDRADKDWWVPMYLPPNRDAVDRAVEQGVMTIYKQGDMEEDAQYFTPYDLKPYQVPPELKEGWKREEEE